MVAIEQVECNRCHYKWFPRKPNYLPANCANRKCNSPYWNKTRVKPVKDNSKQVV
jgi:hypothetical protein